MIDGFAEALLDWYDNNRRNLPWRRTKDPYRVWVSEIMLQQTQVQTVLSYYDAFLTRFPDVQSLAEASRDEVLTAWKGLGYYRRADNLHRAARVVCSEYGGRMPNTYEALRQLPGIGEYTARAVASISFSESYAAVDANVLRIAARLWRIDDPINSSAVQRRVQKKMDQLLAPRRSGSFNQAMMELGQTICKPTAPHCDDCPVGKWCLSAGKADAASFPVRGRTIRPRVERRTVAVIESERGVLMRPRPDRGLLAGMWEFVNVPGSDVSSWPADALPRNWTIDQQSLGRVAHRFTHLIWELDVFWGKAPAKSDLLHVDTKVDALSRWTADASGTKEKPPVEKPAAPSFRWVPHDAVGDTPLPTVMQKVWSLFLHARH